MVWPTPPPEDRSEYQEAVRAAFASTEDILHELGPMPPRFVAKHLAKWRANAIVLLAGPEAERLAFGLTLSPAKGRSAIRQNVYPPLFGLPCGCQCVARTLPT